MVECPNCHRISLDYFAHMRRAECLYRAHCGFSEPVASRDEFHARYGYGGRLVGKEE